MSIRTRSQVLVGSQWLLDNFGVATSDMLQKCLEEKIVEHLRKIHHVFSRLAFEDLSAPLSYYLRRPHSRKLVFFHLSKL